MQSTQPHGGSRYMQQYAGQLSAAMPAEREAKDIEES
jgi:hypothetical protein